MLEYNEDCKDTVESNKNSIINHLKQKPQNLKDRATYDQMQLTRQEIDFKLREKQIDAIESVTDKEVVDFFKRAFFTEPKRITLKQYSPKHFSDKKTLEESKVKVQKTFELIQKAFNVNYMRVPVTLDASQNYIEGVAEYL